MNAMAPVREDGDNWETIQARYLAAKATLNRADDGRSAEQNRIYNDAYTAADDALLACSPPNWAAFLFKLEEILSAGTPTEDVFATLAAQARSLVDVVPDRWDIPDGVDNDFFRGIGRVRGAAMLANLADRLAGAVECFGNVHGSDSLWQREAEDGSNKLFTCLLGHLQNQTPADVADALLLTAAAAMDIDGISDGVPTEMHQSITNTEIVLNNLVGLFGHGSADRARLPHFLSKLVERDIVDYFERAGREVPA